MASRPIDELAREYRKGDPEAQRQLLEQLESLLRNLVRKLVGRQIRSERESLDICQSLLLAFHLDAAGGKIGFESEEALRAYLRTMIRHKLANLSDRIRAAKRGGGTSGVPIEEELQLPAPDPSASMVASTAELRRRIERELTEEERAVLRGRLTGLTNQEIGAKLGRSADAVRMIWNRARQRIQGRGLV